MSAYDYRNCQSLFGYAADVHIRCKGRCQLCGCGGPPLDFNLWRQMTVEHVVGESQGGYLKQIREAVSSRFPELSPETRETIARDIDSANTVTACGFCNSMTSRNGHGKSLPQMLHEVRGGPDEVVAHVCRELARILDRKQSEVREKLTAVKKAFKREVLAKIKEEGS